MHIKELSIKIVATVTLYTSRGEYPEEEYCSSLVSVLNDKIGWWLLFKGTNCERVN